MQWSTICANVFSQTFIENDVATAIVGIVKVGPEVQKACDKVVYSGQWSNETYSE